MKTKAIGYLTGIVVGISLLFVGPLAANALTWTTYVDAYVNANTVRQSTSGKVYENRGRILGTGGGVSFLQKFTVLQNRTKGKILASVTSEAGAWVYLSVPAPQTNTVARCIINGPNSPLTHYRCDVWK